MNILTKISKIIDEGFFFNETQTVIGLCQLKLNSCKRKKRAKQTFQSKKNFNSKVFATESCFFAKDFCKNFNYYELLK